MILAIGNTDSALYHLANGPTAYVEQRFTPAKPASRAAAASGRDSQPYQYERDHIQEKLSAYVIGTENDIRAFVNDLERALEIAAACADNRTGTPQYLYYDPTATGPLFNEVYRSQILGGHVTVLSDGFDNGFVVIEIELTRRFYWEGGLTELALTNGHGSTANGRIVYNTDDATYDDWVTIDGAEIDGVLPTPILVHYTNEDEDRHTRLITSLAVWGGRDHTAAQLSFSDADYNVSDWSGDNEVKVVEWSLTSAQLDNFAGRYYRVLLRLSVSPTGDVWARPRIKFASLTTVYEGDLVLIDDFDYYADLGVVQLPPWLPGEQGLYPLEITLYARRAGGGSLPGSYLKLLPAETYRELIPLGYGSMPNSRIVDDQIEGKIYHQTLSEGYKVGHYYVLGGTQYLWPGHDATFYVKASSTVGSLPLDQQGALRIFYRPRRLSV